MAQGRPLTTKAQETIVKQVHQGVATPKALAERYDVAPTTIYRTLRKAAPGMRSHKAAPTATRKGNGNGMTEAAKILELECQQLEAQLQRRRQALQILTA
jgi:transposase-like protein